MPGFAYLISRMSGAIFDGHHRSLDDAFSLEPGNDVTRQLELIKPSCLGNNKVLDCISYAINYGPPKNETKSPATPIVTFPKALDIRPAPRNQNR